MKLLIDMDGLLTDFIGGVLRKFDVSNPWAIESNLGKYDVCKLLNISPTIFWENINSHEFWAGLDPLNDGLGLLHFLENEFGQKNIALLTSPSLSPYSASGKISWIQEHLPEYSRQFLIGPCKHFCASKDRLLIDDSEKNIASFIKEGGYAILWPQPWNKEYSKIAEKETYIADRISTILNNL